MKIDIQINDVSKASGVLKLLAKCSPECRGGRLEKGEARFAVPIVSIVIECKRNIR